jgi:LysM repeat protein
MSEADVERDGIEEPPTVADEPEVILVDAEPEDETQGELIKFALLAVVLLSTALVIGLLRPYIFNTIIPAVLGEGQPVAPLVNTETEAETIKPDTEEDQVDTPAAEAESIEETEAVEESGTDEEEASNEPVNPADFPTAVPAQTHTVQLGETLTAIARQYNITVQAIVETNSISNPDRVTAGTVLTIPEGQ